MITVRASHARERKLQHSYDNGTHRMESDESIGCAMERVLHCERISLAGITIRQWSLCSADSTCASQQSRHSVLCIAGTGSNYSAHCHTGSPHLRQAISPVLLSLQRATGNIQQALCRGTCRLYYIYIPGTWHILYFVY